MKIDSKNENHLIASDGMVLVQVSSGIVFGKEVFLGKVMINGEIVDDFIENFIEFEEENNEFNINENEIS